MAIQTYPVTSCHLDLPARKISPWQRAFRYCTELSDWGRVAPHPTSEWQCYLAHSVLFFSIRNVRKWQWKREEKENWRILTNQEIYGRVEKPTVIETVRLNRLCWFGHYREWKKIGFPKQYYIWIWEQQDWEVDQDTDGKMRGERMDE